jgi:hypothetical protein
MTMINDKPPRIVYAKPPLRTRTNAPPAKVAIPAVIATAKKPSKVAVERRYARMLQKPDTEEP